MARNTKATFSTMLCGALVLVGCSSTPEKAPVAECLFADGSNVEAPAWVCGAPIEGVELAAVGYSDKSVAGPNFMKQMASTAARVELAQVLSLDIENMIKQYAETTGAGDSETVDRVNTAVTKQITDQTLIGSKIIRQMPTPTGGIVVLVGLDPSGVDSIAKELLRTSMNNEQALFQKFQAEKSFEELTEEIAKRRR
ncbi:LPP20 family lipoprotein [Marinomonas sp. 15G1-11]|uniref:LPP20 family lipoprotein n=1 Tax=Marinomonas phaeophyticola TaxID=3004091 RepID=A0ABT4JTK5_9GAMM|nr:LPP20 family lipoprotein [Marinomonas sp. 15G1-11]MCZ2721143.1 LPP20 family lipoprotein [Marinomonas sp. 15G1-11]